jgi:hypothetical protein
VKLSSNGTIISRREVGDQYSFSNHASFEREIILDNGEYIEKNQIFVTMRSRKATLLGWNVCSSGYIDISSGLVNIETEGSYINHSVRPKTGPGLSSYKK